MIVPECTPSYLNSARHVHSVLRLWTSYGQKTNFFRRFPWVLEPYRYHSLDEVQASLEDEMVVLQKPHSKMFQTCGSATLSWSERTINASEGTDDCPSIALPLLPRDRYCEACDVT